MACNDNKVIPLKSIDPGDKKTNGELSYNEVVNSFLVLANRHWQTIEIEDVSAALREAAARFNAFEASEKSTNLQADKEDASYWFTQHYGEMLNNFIDEHIQKTSKS